MEKVVIFDLDGTVIDTIYDITDAMNLTLINFGFPPITVEKMKSCVGGDSKEIIRQAIGKEISNDLLDKCVAFYTEKYVSNGSPKTKLFNGIDIVISDLKKRGYKICALSNKPDHEIAPLKETILKPLGFDMVVGVSEKVAPKPSTKGVEYILKTLNANKENSYLVGDGETDIITAIKSSLNCIGVLWGNRTREFLEKFGAKTFAKNPGELLKLIG